MRRKGDDSGGVRREFEDRRPGNWRDPRWFQALRGGEVGNNALTALCYLGGDSGGRGGSHFSGKRPGGALRQEWGGLVGALDGDGKPGPSGA